MSNSPTLCQYFEQQLLEIIFRQFPQSIIYHYIIDILLADSDVDTLEKMFGENKEFFLVGVCRLFLEKKYRVMTTMGIPIRIKTDSVPAVR